MATDDEGWTASEKEDGGSGSKSGIVHDPVNDLSFVIVLARSTLRKEGFVGGTFVLGSSSSSDDSSKDSTSDSKVSFLT